jgi:rfaE bifunctional protein nucleotidyltransferase chain/domain
MIHVKNLSEFDSAKIKTIEELKNINNKYKKNGKSIGLCVGSYDLLHPGHIRHFQSAKQLCDILLVAVATDEYVRKRKGYNRPIIPEKLRAYSISQLETVDYVLISKFNRATDLIHQLKPSFYIKGSDYINKQTPGITAERKAIKNVGGEIKYTCDEKFSTTSIISQIRKNINKNILIIGEGLPILEKSVLLKEYAKKQNFVYIKKKDIDDIITVIFNKKTIFSKKYAKNFQELKSNIDQEEYMAMLRLAKKNLENGLNVVIDCYYNEKLDLPAINNYINDLSEIFHVIKIYFKDNKKHLSGTMKKKNYVKDKDRLNFSKIQAHNHENIDFSEFDIIFNKDGNIAVNVDSLSHEIMNIIHRD